jgi:hypothetical protein
MLVNYTQDTKYSGAHGEFRIARCHLEKARLKAGSEIHEATDVLGLCVDC